MFRKCAAVFDIDSEIISKEEILSAGEIAIMCMYNFKHHNVGINVLNNISEHSGKHHK